MTVLIDGSEGEVALARGPGDASEIDGQVLVEGAGELPPGTLCEVEITQATEHDSVGPARVIRRQSAPARESRG